uniref:Uncharacterized protein n=1 Tax=Romanomermis culicivorax TaxID=13658 RepID=A0A915LAV5_ROMCU
ISEISEFCYSKLKFSKSVLKVNRQTAAARSVCFSANIFCRNWSLWAGKRSLAMPPPQPHKFNRRSRSGLT